MTFVISDGILPSLIVPFLNPRSPTFFIPATWFPSSPCLDASPSPCSSSLPLATMIPPSHRWPSCFPPPYVLLVAQIPPLRGRVSSLRATSCGETPRCLSLLSVSLCATGCHTFPLSLHAASYLDSLPQVWVFSLDAVDHQDPPPQAPLLPPSFLACRRPPRFHPPEAKFPPYAPLTTKIPPGCLSFFPISLHVVSHCASPYHRLPLPLTITKLLPSGTSPPSSFLAPPCHYLLSPFPTAELPYHQEYFTMAFSGQYLHLFF